MGPDVSRDDRFEPAYLALTRAGVFHVAAHQVRHRLDGGIMGTSRGQDIPTIPSA